MALSIRRYFRTTHRRKFTRFAVERLEDRTTPTLFNPQTPFTSSFTNASDGVLADFNNDGKLDLAVAGAVSNNVTVMLGNGNGTFGGATGVASGGTNTYFLVAADLNGDGNQDIAVVNVNSTSQIAPPGTVNILLGNGGGGFTQAAGSPFQTGGNNAFGLTVADYTGDGIPDIAVCNFGNASADGQSFTGNNISVFQGTNDGSGKGTGQYTSLTTITNGLTFVPTAITSADMNADGKPDIVVCMPGIPADTNDPPIDGTIAIYLNNGTGGFTAAGTADSGGIYPVAITTGDTSGDGKPDVIVSNAGDINDLALTGQGVAVLVNSGGGNINPPTTITTSISSPFMTTAADFTGDGKIDLGVVNLGALSGSNGYVSAYANTGSSFTSADGSPYSSGSGFGAGQVIIAGDLNGDGAIDLVALGDGHKGQVLLNTTTPGASTTTSLTGSPNPSTYGTSVTFTATVTSGSGTPTGTVTFLDGATTLGTGTLSSGTATFNTSTLTVGTHSVTARYEGAGGFSTSTSSAFSQTVNGAATTTTLVGAPNPSNFGDSVTFTATVGSTAGTPTGTVTFFDGANQLGTGSLTGGTATFSTSTLTVGSHSITASYGAAGNFAGSTSSAFTQTVNGASTTTSVTGTPNPSNFGDSVTFTATVGSTAGTPT
ncbi:MAG TPA: Ig-like domain repeat protein, partial [Fimbriiglobus sp.]